MTDRYWLRCARMAAAWAATTADPALKRLLARMAVRYLLCAERLPKSWEARA